MGFDGPKSSKWIFIVTNTFFVLSDIVVYVNKPKPSLFEVKQIEEQHVLSVKFDELRIGTSILGLYGAYREKKMALISFCVLQCCDIAILTSAVVYLIVRSKLCYFKESIEICALTNAIMHQTLVPVLGQTTSALLRMVMAILLIYDLKGTSNGLDIAALTKRLQSETP